MQKHKFLHGKTTVGERGQIVIPQNIRRALKIKAGQEMIVIAKENKVIVMPAEHLEHFFRTVLGNIADLRSAHRKK